MALSQYFPRRRRHGYNDRRFWYSGVPVLDDALERGYQVYDAFGNASQYATNIFNEVKDRRVSFLESQEQQAAALNGTSHNNNKMPTILGGKIPSVSAATSLTQYGHSKRVLGKRARKQRRSWKDMEQPYQIYRFQGLSDFTSTRKHGVYGLFPCSFRSSSPESYTLFNTLTDTNAVYSVAYNCTAMPMYAYNLSALPSGRVINPNANNSLPGQTDGTRGYAIPMYQLVKTMMSISGSISNPQSTIEPFVYYSWQPVRGNCNGRLGATTDEAGTMVNFTANPGDSYPLLANCFVEEQNVPVSVQQPVYKHEWSDIGVAVYGSATRSTCCRVSLVNFLNETAAPSRLWSDTATLSTNNQKLFNKDFGDDRDIDLQQNATAGLIPSCPGLTVNGATGHRIFDYPIEIDNATSFWDSYWCNRMGHPLVYSKNRGSHQKLWNVQHTECITLAPNNTMNAAMKDNEQVSQHVHKIFKRFEKPVDTYIPAQGGLSSNFNVGAGPLIYRSFVTEGDPVMQNVGMTNTGTIQTPPGNLAVAGYGCSTKNSVTTCHIYGNNPKRDTWLIIESENPYSYVPQVTSSTNKPFMFGGLGSGGGTQSCYSDRELTFATSDLGNVTNYPSFDLMVRSKYCVQNNVLMSSTS